MEKRVMSIHQAEIVLRSIASIEHYLNRLVEALESKEGAQSTSYYQQAKRAYDTLYNLRIATFYETVRRPTEDTSAKSVPAELNAIPCNDA